MKKLITVIALVFSLFVRAQDNPPSSTYTPINTTGYDELRMRIRALHLPTGGATPTLAPKQWLAAGAVFIDTINNKLYLWSSGGWHDVTGGGGAVTGSKSIAVSLNNVTLVNDSTILVNKSIYSWDGTTRGWHKSVNYNPVGLVAGHQIIDQDGTGFNLTNAPTDGLCTRLIDNITVSKVSALLYYVSPGWYKIKCLPYYWPGGNVPISPGDADPGEFREDLIIMRTTGADTLKGENSTGGVGVDPVADPDNEIVLTVVRIDEDETDDSQITSTVLWHEGYSTGDGYWTRTATIDSLYTGVAAYEGTHSVRLFGATNGQYLQLNNRFGATLNKNDYTNFQLFYYNIAGLNVNRTLNISLRFGNAQALGTNSVNISNWGYLRGMLGQWLPINIPSWAFGGGSPLFTSIRITDVGVGGTPNVLFDEINFQKGITSGTPPPAVTKQVFFNSIAELRAYSGTPDITAITLGYTINTDGGGAEYRWDGTSVAADNGGTVIKLTSVVTGRMLMNIKNHSVNVKQFGARGNGVTDDRPAFVASYSALSRIGIAFNQYTRGSILIPQPDSVYYLSDSLLYDDQISLYGATQAQFPFATIKLNFAAGKSGLVFKMGNPSGGSRASYAENLAVFGLGSSTDTFKNGVWANGLIYLKNIHSENFGGCGITIASIIAGSNANVSRLDDCSGQQNGLDGLRVDGGESSALSIINPNFQFNGRFNIQDRGFLGSNIFGGHTSGAGMRSGYTSDAIASRGGHYYICKVYHINKQPGVAADWMDYWEDVGTSIEIPGSVAAWGSGTTYHEAANYGATGAAQAATTFGLYREGGTGGDLNGGSSINVGGAGASFFKKIGALISGREGYINAESGQGVQVRDHTDNNIYTRLDADAGLVIGNNTAGNSSELQIKAFPADSIIKQYATNDGVARMFWPGAAVYGSKFGVTGNISTAGIPVISKFGLWFADVTQSSAYASMTTIRPMTMGVSYPPSEGLKWPKGTIVWNNNISSNDTLLWVANKETGGGSWADWDPVLKTGSGGGGGGLPAGMTYDDGTGTLAFGDGSIRDNGSNMRFVSSDGYEMYNGKNYIFSLYNGAGADGITIYPYARALDGLTTTGIAIGSSSPAASAKLEVQGTTKGFLTPRLTTTQKNAISSPAEGLEVYDLTLHKKCVYTGGAWETITSL